MAGGERGLFPGSVVGSEARERFETLPDSVVEAAHGLRVGLRRDDPSGVNHFAKGSAIAEKEKSDLRIWKLSDGFEDGGGFFDSFGSVVVAEVWAPYGPAKEFEVTAG